MEQKISTNLEPNMINASLWGYPKQKRAFLEYDFIIKGINGRKLNNGLKNSCLGLNVQLIF